MRKLKGISPLVRAIGVFGAVAIVVGGATFALESTPVTLTNSSFTSATAGLQVKTTGSFAAQDGGFHITGVVPGGGASPATPFAFHLKNTGDVDLDISAKLPTMPTFTGSGTVDLSKVSLVLSCTTAGGKHLTATKTLTSLATSQVLTPDVLPAGADSEAVCGAQIKMDADAITGTGPVNSSNFNVEFTGTQHVTAI